MYEAVAFQGWWLACRNTSEQSNQASDLSFYSFSLPRYVFECYIANFDERYWLNILRIPMSDVSLHWQIASLV